MKFIKINKTFAPKAQGYPVTYINDDPDGELAQPQYDAFRADGYFIEEIPLPDDNGMGWAMYYNPDSHTIDYEYTALPPNPQDEISALRQQVSELQGAMDFLVMNMPM